MSNVFFMRCLNANIKDTEIKKENLKIKERRNGRMRTHSCGEVSCKRDDISKNCHIYNLIVSLNTSLKQVS